LKQLVTKRSAKEERERKILLGLIEFYLKNGKPVGSNTLKEAGFGDLSSATIRNYFANLEKEGYLSQQHTSGGRIPTAQAFRLYAQEYAESDYSDIFQEDPSFATYRNAETREITSYLQGAAETLSDLTQSAVFMSAPRFDHDYLVELKLMPIDQLRCLCVMITDFGVVLTEILQTEKKLNAFTVKRLESYFHWRLTGNDKPENLNKEEEQLAQKFYNELMVRFIVGYSNFTDDEIYRTGFSKLLAYPEFHSPLSLAGSLSLFENVHSMRLLLKECSSVNHLKFWIGDDLIPFTQEPPNCAVLAIPYYINLQPVGSFGILGTMRMPYRQLFAIIRTFSECISTALTRNIFKHKITFRQPKSETPYLQKEESRLIGQSRLMLLEDKS
jgi:heat-inducible transcriptional repressor